MCDPSTSLVLYTGRGQVRLVECSPLAPLREVPTGRILVEFFFCFFPQKPAKKNETNISPVRTERASSIKVFIIMALFQISWQHSTFYRQNVLATIRQEKLFLLRYWFHRSSAKIFGRTKRKRFLLNAKMFRFEYLFKNTLESVKSVTKYGLLREPITVLHFTMDQFSHNKRYYWPSRSLQEHSDGKIS